jgi:hypothetical protein
MGDKTRAIVLSFLCLLSSQAATAFEKENWGYGIFAKAGTYTIDDPAGDVDETFSTNFGAKIMFFPQARGQRAFFALESGGFTLDADRSGLVNADVSMLAARLGYETRFNFTRNFKVWLGGSINAANIQVEDRYTLASDGFLDETYKDRDDSAVGFTLYLDTYFELTEQGDIEVGFGPYYDKYSNDGVEAVGLKVTLQRK